MKVSEPYLLSSGKLWLNWPNYCNISNSCFLRMVAFCSHRLKMRLNFQIVSVVKGWMVNDQFGQLEDGFQWNSPNSIDKWPCALLQCPKSPIDNCTWWSVSGGWSCGASQRAMRMNCPSCQLLFTHIVLCWPMVKWSCGAWGGGVGRERRVWGGCSGGHRVPSIHCSACLPVPKAPPTQTNKQTVLLGHLKKYQLRGWQKNQTVSRFGQIGFWKISVSARWGNCVQRGGLQRWQMCKKSGRVGVKKKWWEGRFLLLLHLLLPVPTLLFLSSGAGRGLSGTVAATLSREQRRGGGRGGDEKEEEKGKWRRRRRRRRRRMLWPRWGWEAARPARHPRAGYCNWQEDTSHPLQSWKNALDADFKVCRKNMLYFDIWWQKRHNTPVSQKKMSKDTKMQSNADLNRLSKMTADT